AEARTAADRTLQCTPDASASEEAAVARLQASQAERAGRFATEEVALALNISPTSAAKQLTLAQDLHDAPPEWGEVVELGRGSGFVELMVPRPPRRLSDRARRSLD